MHHLISEIIYPLCGMVHKYHTQIGAVQQLFSGFSATIFMYKNNPLKAQFKLINPVVCLSLELFL